MDPLHPVVSTCGLTRARPIRSRCRHRGEGRGPSGHRPPPVRRTVVHPPGRGGHDRQGEPQPISDTVQVRFGGQSGSGNSSLSNAGIQKYLNRSPIGVPGPVCVNLRLSSLFSISSPITCRLNNLSFLLLRQLLQLWIYSVLYLDIFFLITISKV